MKKLSAILSLLSAAITLGIGVAGAMVWEGKFTAAIATATGLAALGALISLIWSRRVDRERAQQRVFIVYAREDLETARDLAKQLESRGFNPWLDVDQVVPGQVWQSAVLNALEQSAAALVLVSKNLSKKGFVQQELKTALDTLRDPEKDVSPIVPVRLDDTPVPEPLSKVQWVNLFEPDGLDRLESGLRRITANGANVEATLVR